MMNNNTKKMPQIMRHFYIQINSVLKQKLILLVCPPASGVFPAFFIYQVNFGEIPASVFIISAAVSVLASIVIYAVISAAVRTMSTASAVMYFLAVAFYSYGLLYDSIDPSSIHGLFSSQLLWITVYFLICSLIIRFIIKLGDRIDFRNFVWSMAVFLIALYSINAGMLFYKAIAIDKGRDVLQETAVDSEVAASGIGNYPDIYFIVLDEYASSETIEKYYGYSNAGFEKYLEGKGFEVFKESVAPFDSTEQVLASLLGMKKISPDTTSRQAYGIIAENPAASFLKDYGYKYVHIGSSLEVNKIKIKGADYYYNYFSTRHFYTDDDLSSKLIDMSVLRPFFYTAEWTVVQQKAVRYSFDSLKQAGDIAGPKLVYAHIMCPHHPFVFDREGGPLKISDRKNWTDKSIYLGQYIYVTGLVENFLDELLEGVNGDTAKPVVIIQSDHGPRKTPGASEDHRYKIFNTMLLPGFEGTAGIDGFSSENTFPYIFELYFNKQP